MKIKVGMGPDFIMRIELMDLFHKASCSILHADQLGHSSTVFSDRSLFSVAILLRRYLEVKNIDLSIFELEKNELSLLVLSPNVAIALALPRGLSINDKIKLRVNFLKFMSLDKN